MASSDSFALCKTERLSAKPCLESDLGRSSDETGTARSIARAAALLQSGGTVAFPTETVYGLGANALDAGAVLRIFAAKQRPDWDPLIVHIAGREMLAQVADLNRLSPEIRERMEALMAAFWPGPLTLLLPRTAAIPDAVTAGRTLVGVRMPRHPLALALIRSTGLPLAAPSANRFGHTSPTTAEHVLEDLDDRIDAVLDGGPAEVGLESTVLDPAPTPMVIYRPGAVTAAMIADVAGAGVVSFVSHSSGAAPESLPSPGGGIRHYAPRARLHLVALPAESPAAAWLETLPRLPPGAALLLPNGWPAPSSCLTFNWGSWSHPDELAHNLYAGLRALDTPETIAIVCPIPAGEGVAAALRDRLEKAARTH